VLHVVAFAKNETEESVNFFSLELSSWSVSLAGNWKGTLCFSNTGVMPHKLHLWDLKSLAVAVGCSENQKTAIRKKILSPLCNCDVTYEQCPVDSTLLVIAWHSPILSPCSRSYML
jgi:hypothetical protein